MDVLVLCLVGVACLVACWAALVAVDAAERRANEAKKTRRVKPCQCRMRAAIKSRVDF